ncbi:hypothetical protein XENOCAPTIV_017252 [Xenoophorus captivus]|uniref:Uncharacterized protein n=1 Tax=Xenoophorus captivus TaxID=1517983 RepID=A0ABV0RHS0_9TELE
MLHVSATPRWCNWMVPFLCLTTALFFIDVPNAGPLLSVLHSLSLFFLVAASLSLQSDNLIKGPVGRAAFPSQRCLLQGINMASLLLSFSLRSGLSFRSPRLPFSLLHSPTRGCGGCSRCPYSLFLHVPKSLLFL